MCCFEEILEAALHKTVAVWSLPSYLTHYPSKTSKTCWALLGRQKRWMSIGIDGESESKETMLSAWLDNDYIYIYFFFPGNLHTVGFYPYLLSYCLFEKNKYQIHSYITFNMDDSKWSIHMKTYVAYFSINGRFCLVSLKNPTFSNIFPRAKHVLMTFEFWTLCACLSIFSLYISHLLLSSQQAPIALWTISYPSPDDGYWNRNVNVDFTSWYIHLFGLYFSCYLHIYIYIYIFSIEELMLYSYWITMTRKSGKHLHATYGN